MHSKMISDNGGGISFLARSIILLLLVAVAWQAAGLTWKIAGSTGKDHAGKPSPSNIKSSSIRQNTIKKSTAVAEVPLFGIGERVVAPQSSKVQKDAPITSLALILKGIVKIDPIKRAMAIIAEKAKPDEEKLYSIGDTVPGNAVVDNIFFDRVILRRGGVVETLLLIGKEISKDSAPPARSANTIQPSGDGVNWQIDRGYWNNRLADIPSLAKEIGVEIYRENNVQKGYRLLSARGSKLLKDLGLQPGDVLHEVNGVPLNSVHDGLAAYKNISNATEVRLTISRNGNRESRVYRIGR